MLSENGKETPYINSRRSVYCVHHKQREIYTEIQNSEKVSTPKTKKRFEKKPERKSKFVFKKSNNMSVDSRYHGNLKDSGIFGIWGKYLQT